MRNFFTSVTCALLVSISGTRLMQAQQSAIDMLLAVEVDDKLPPYFQNLENLKQVGEKVFDIPTDGLGEISLEALEGQKAVENTYSRRAWYYSPKGVLTRFVAASLTPDPSKGFAYSITNVSFDPKGRKESVVQTDSVVFKGPTTVTKLEYKIKYYPDGTRNQLQCISMGEVVGTLDFSPVEKGSQTLRYSSSEVKDKVVGKHTLDKQGRVIRRELYPSASELQEEGFDFYTYQLSEYDQYGLIKRSEALWNGSIPIDSIITWEKRKDEKTILEYGEERYSFIEGRAVIFHDIDATTITHYDTNGFPAKGTRGYSSVFDGPLPDEYDKQVPVRWIKGRGDLGLPPVMYEVEQELSSKELTIHRHKYAVELYD